MSQANCSCTQLWLENCLWWTRPPVRIPGVQEAQSYAKFAYFVKLSMLSWKNKNQNNHPTQKMLISANENYWPNFFSTTVFFVTFQLNQLIFSVYLRRFLISKDNNDTG